MYSSAVSITLAGTPTATESLGISFVTIEPAPITTLSPMVTPPHHDRAVTDVDVAAQNNWAGNLQIGDVLAK